MRVSVKNVSVEYGGEIKGLDAVLSLVVQSRNEEPGFEDANQISMDLERLSRQLVELAWICRRFAEAGVPIGYAVEVCVTRKSIKMVQFYRVETAPSPLLPAKQALVLWHSPAFR